MTRALYAVARRALFRLEAERAHELAVLALRAAEPSARALRRAAPSGPGRESPLGQRVLGLYFPSPIGLAAGFDKNAIAPHVWPLLGFGFAELGTVTALPQPGNPRPRLFRLEAEHAIVNRLGFNNDGAERVAERLGRLLAGRRPLIPLGLNLGCSRVAIGDRARELADYCASARLLAPHADYLAINVSSPNTPGLRDLQEPGRLGDLVRAIRAELGGLAARRPLLVKLAPDLADPAVQEVVTAARDAGADGFIAGNTTLARPGCTSPAAAEAGGLSGAPLRARATELVRMVRAAAGPELPIIGVGGVTTVGDVIEKLAAGANLVALYTALIYEGPLLAARLARALRVELDRRGVSSIAHLARAAAAAPLAPPGRAYPA